jgi:hypothetical protein
MLRKFWLTENIHAFAASVPRTQQFWRALDEGVFGFREIIA